MRPLLRKYCEEMRDRSAAEEPEIPTFGASGGISGGEGGASGGYSAAQGFGRDAAKEDRIAVFGGTRVIAAAVCADVFLRANRKAPAYFGGKCEKARTAYYKTFKGEPFG